MDLTISIKKQVQVQVKTLKVKAHVRYWGDSDINGVSDENGDLTPCRNGDLWCPEIDLKTGVILNWEQGKEARIDFKVCDQCSWSILDITGVEVLSVENQYVPSSLCPEENGYWDYIIMNIDKSGQIKNWKVDLSDFQHDEDD